MSKSVAISNSQQTMNRDTKSDNEYGLDSSKNKLSLLKSFEMSDLKNSVTGSSMDTLTIDEIEHNLGMLIGFMKSGKDHNVISTLKILLNHYTRKVSRSKPSKHHYTISMNLSPNHKATILNSITTSIPEEYESSPKPAPKSTISNVLRSNFNEDERNSQISNHAKYFNFVQSSETPSSSSFMDNSQAKPGKTPKTNAKKTKRLEYCTKTGKISEPTLTSRVVKTSRKNYEVKEIELDVAKNLSSKEIGKQISNLFTLKYLC